MATKHICDKCGSEKDVKRVKANALGRNIDEYDKEMLNKDLCGPCRIKLSVILVKFMNNDDIVFQR